MEKKHKHRNRVNASVRWKAEDLAILMNEIVNNVKEDLSSFEKPTAKEFYKNLMKNNSTLKKYTWMCMRDKLKNLRRKHKQAIELSKQAGHDVKANTAIAETIKRNCPHFEELNFIFENKLNMSVQDFDSGELLLQRLAAFEPKASAQDPIRLDSVEDLIQEQHSCSSMASDWQEQEQKPFYLNGDIEPQLDQQHHQPPTMMGSVAWENQQLDSTDQWPRIEHVTSNGIPVPTHQQKQSHQINPADLHSCQSSCHKTKRKHCSKIDSAYLQIAYLHKHEQARLDYKKAKIEMEEKRMELEKEKFEKHIALEYEKLELKRKKLELKRTELDVKKQLELVKLQNQKEIEMHEISLKSKNN